MSSKILRNFKTKTQISELSPVDLIKYKKDLDSTYTDLKSEVETFIIAYKNTKLAMQYKLNVLESLTEKLEELRLTSDADSNMHFLKIQ